MTFFKSYLPDLDALSFNLLILKVNGSPDYVTLWSCNVFCNPQTCLTLFQPFITGEVKPIQIPTAVQLAPGQAPDTEKAFEALAAVGQLQQQLM